MDIFNNAHKLASAPTSIPGAVSQQHLSAGDIFLVLFVAILIIVIYAFLIMICWNFVVPKLFKGSNVARISLTQAIVLKILLSLLFSSGACVCLQK